ncbi:MULTISPECIES: FMN-binding negative transcriptional regulator [unclassified Undibacterium]|uniref:FMN-binding negative transcriptional regulator n=1 Tax=unclassified Undibacterium TaxID=2630295 RepID=UPI002AC9E405|nr:MULTISPECIES: FMN-binding negative transcriptional regulator [unclassified Undibacterium]MEB0138137.1 FMN-binding negative transcriptional regulator [Undibacterium sp. CCC2.1]MEB0171108.1 FMN-binding negative transcriptional regulator [Undibacterium sp. CCC1.1]MEB0175153.1 FMN-binding negative transcriptional regulator [Undibacterium sp. CCC3.4]MEB0214263.1 FMN-binding negative transcriptional regulator [Undibacterium sp. 5I2]WPX41843.1 FMN-binding negative transcriptional regulator [Undiba
MYQPAHFIENRLEVLQQLIAAHPLACLVHHDEHGLDADYLPMLLSAPTAAAPFGTLRGHVARNNPLWKNQDQVMLLFQGPSAYITPSWYAEKKLNGAVVPTYNYAVVQAYGRIQLVEDPAVFLALLTDLTQHFETPRSQPWQVSDAPPDYIRNLMNEIIGIEITLTRLSGKWKTSQNKSLQNRSHIAVSLRDDAPVAAADLADLMERQLFEP